MSFRSSSYCRLLQRRGDGIGVRFNPHPTPYNSTRGVSHNITHPPIASFSCLSNRSSLTDFGGVVSGSSSTSLPLARCVRRVGPESRSETSVPNIYTVIQRSFSQRKRGTVASQYATSPSQPMPADGPFTSTVSDGKEQSSKGSDHGGSGNGNQGTNDGNRNTSGGKQPNSSLPWLIGLGTIAGAGYAARVWWKQVRSEYTNPVIPQISVDPPELEVDEEGNTITPFSSTPEPLPSLITEHLTLPFFPRMWFYTRLIGRGIFLYIIWTPVLLSGLILPSRLWLKMLLSTIELSGPVFIKLGQWASTRPDLFPPKICLYLQQLQAGVRAHSFDVSLETCKETFGDSLISGDEQLVLDKKVLGSGSMGQVHLGQVINWKDGTKKEVAIKVLHPNLHSIVNRDLTLFYYLATAIHAIPYAELKWLAVPQMLIQFTQFMSSHLDLFHEARSMEHFQRDFKNNPNIIFPSPVYPFVSEHVLVQTLAKGIPLSKFLGDQDLDRMKIDWKSSPIHRMIAEKIRHSHLLRHRQAKEEAQQLGERLILPPQPESSSPLHTEIAHLGLQMYLRMLIKDNFIHSDLHPGNLLVQLPGISVDGSELKGSVQDMVHQYNAESTNELKSSHCNLVVLDSGLVTELNAQNRKNFLSLFGALLIRDGRLASRLLLAYSPQQQCRDPEALAEDMHKIVNAIPLEHIGRVDFGQLLGEVMNCVRHHHVQLESDFASLVISLAVIEGIGRQLAPELSLFQEALPIVLKDRQARHILLKTVGIRKCIKLGIAIGKEEMKAYMDKEKDKGKHD